MQQLLEQQMKDAPRRCSKRDRQRPWLAAGDPQVGEDEQRDREREPDQQHDRDEAGHPRKDGERCQPRTRRALWALRPPQVDDHLRQCEHEQRDAHDERK